MYQSLEQIKDLDHACTIFKVLVILMHTSMHAYTEIGHSHLMVFISINVFYNSSVPVYNEILLSYSTSEPVEISSYGSWGNDKLQCRFNEDLIVNILFQNLLYSILK